MTVRQVLTLPPREGNPRNSEGAFLPLADGSLLFVYSRFCGVNGSDNAEAEISSIVSRDGGETWGEERTLFRASDFEGCENVMSVSLLRMADGAVGLFFLIRKSFADTRLNLFRSYDEGATWSAPTLCVPHKGYFVTNNDRVIRTSAGRLIVPANLHINKASSDSEARNWQSFTSHGLGYFFYSDDDGFTWNEAPDFCRLPFSDSVAGLQETGVTELRDGLLLAYFRTDMGMQYKSYSFDGGLHWTPVEPMRYFTSPNSPMKIAGLSDGRLLAIWNPIPVYNGRSCSGVSAGRTPLACAISTDRGESWNRLENIAEDPEKGYCYPAICEIGNGVLVAFCAGGTADKGCLNRLDIVKLTF